MNVNALFYRPVVLIGLLLMGDVATARQIDGWQVEGMHGELQIAGEMMLSPCVLAMESEQQTVRLGEIPRYRLERPGSRTPPVAFRLRLLDCGSSTPELHNNQQGGTGVYAPDQPGVFISFIGEQLDGGSRLFRLQGTAKGIALRISDRDRQQIFPGARSNPLLLNQGNNSLVFYAQLEKGIGELHTGTFSTLINFTLDYL